MGHNAPAVEPVHIESYADDAVARLPLRLKQPVTEALVRLRAGRWQALEDAAYDLLQGMYLVHAQGLTLDYWGAIVGEARDGLADADYRRFIAARIRAKRSPATPDDFIEILQIAMEPIRIRLFHLGRLTAKLEYVLPQYSSAAIRTKLMRILNASVPVGVKLLVCEARTVPFGFDGVDGSFGEGILSERLDSWG